METTHGSDPRSGNGISLKKKKRKTKKKTTPVAPSNGGTDWKAVALKAQEEANELKVRVRHLEKEADLYKKKCSELKKRFDTAFSGVLGEREAVILKTLTSLWGTLINFQAYCSVDKKRIEELVESTLPVLKQRVEVTTRPL